MTRKDIDLESFTWPQSIRGINNLDTEIKEAIYLSIIPDEVLNQFKIDPHNRELLRINAPHDTRSFEIVYFHEADAIDPVSYLHMADTLNNQIVVLLVVINDPIGPRYYTDVDENGHPTRFGTLRRNIPEEVRAMNAGLAPGQVRRGLRLSRHIVPVFEQFIANAGHDMVIIEPLTYNNAIVYERYGFAYFQGRKRMEWINEALRPSGEHFDKFDASTPFRQPEAWKSIRGRSWAIHDGILDEPFGNLRMYKRVAHNAGVNTFPDGIW